jgi:hypothetical protein
MTKHNARLIIDLGNSQTRLAVIDENNTDKPKIITLSNRYAEVTTQDIDNSIQPNYSEDTVVMDIDGSLWANGSYVEAEQSMSAMRPTSTEKKYESFISLLTIRLAIYEGTRVLAHRYSEDTDKCEVEWKIVFLLPPNDVHSADEMIEKIKDIDTIKLVFPNYVINTSVTQVNVLAEGLAAFLAATFTHVNELRKGYDKYISSPILIVDIGAGTTDFMIIDKAKPIENTRDTLDMGGTKVMTNLKRYFRSRSEFGNLSEVQVAKAAETGILKLGEKSFDVSEAVNQIKASVAKEITAGIVEYFETISYPSNSISYIYVVGGGSLSSDKIQSMGDLLEDSLHRFVPYAKLMPVPEDCNARLMNLYGGIVFSESK